MTLPAERPKELSKVVRFFQNRKSKYIFLIVDNESFARELAASIRSELGIGEKNIEILELLEGEGPVFSQIENHLAGRGKVD